jgi:hypothetical protein
MAQYTNDIGLLMAQRTNSIESNSKLLEVSNALSDYTLLTEIKSFNDKA